MIRRLTVSNYRSLGAQVTVELGQLTALVGPNGSGKSNVVDVLRFVSDAMHTGLSGAVAHRNGIGAVRRWSEGRPFNVRIQLDLDLGPGCPASYRFELNGNSPEEYRVESEEAQVSKDGERAGFRIESSRWVDGPPGLAPTVDERSLALPLVGGDSRFQPLVHALQQIAVYSIFPDSLRAPQKYNSDKPMDRHGSNWASILRDQPEASWKPDLVAALQQLTGDTEDIQVAQAAGYWVVQFLHGAVPRDRKNGHRAEKWVDAGQESDGTLRAAGIVTALLQEPPLPFIGIEEPELTIHPGAIPLLHDFLRQASRRSQVLVTTHSPELLDLIDANDVRVVQRGPEGTTVLPMAASQLGAVKRGLLSLGDVLRTEGLRQELALAVGE